MHQMKPYNTLATFGKLAVGVEAVSSVFLGVTMLMAGSYLIGTKTVQCPARVLDVVYDEQTMACTITVEYSYKNKAYKGSFKTTDFESYIPGGITTIKLNPLKPSEVHEDLPLKMIGTGFLCGALGLGILAWFALQLVSDSRNLAALAGVATFLKLSFI